MRVVKINAALANSVHIGRRGENLATQIVYDGYPEPGQSVQVFVERPGDSAAYPAARVELDDGEQVIRWTVTATDTDKQGKGKVQYRYEKNGQVVKTEIFGILVTEAIDIDPQDPPDPYESWIDSLTELAGETQVNARMARESASEAASSAVDAAIYAGESELYAHEAAESAANAEQSAARAGWVHFWIDQETGHAYAAMTQNVADKCSFSINEETGNTEVTFYG